MYWRYLQRKDSFFLKNELITFFKAIFLYFHSCAQDCFVYFRKCFSGEVCGLLASFWQNVRMFKVFQMQAVLYIGEKERKRERFYILPWFHLDFEKGRERQRQREIFYILPWSQVNRMQCLYIYTCILHILEYLMNLR